jgi:hypothetical protein
MLFFLDCIYTCKFILSYMKYISDSLLKKCLILLVKLSELISLIFLSNVLWLLFWYWNIFVSDLGYRAIFPKLRFSEFWGLVREIQWRQSSSHLCLPTARSFTRTQLAPCFSSQPETSRENVRKGASGKYKWRNALLCSTSHYSGRVAIKQENYTYARTLHATIFLYENQLYLLLLILFLCPFTLPSAYLNGPKKW